MELTEIEPVGALAPEKAAKPKPIEWVHLAPIIAVCAAFGAAFWSLLSKLPGLWFGDDTYYAHGVVVPICAGLIVWDRWDKIKALPQRGQWWVLALLLPVLYVNAISGPVELMGAMSVFLVATLLMGVLLVWGWKHLRLLFVPVVYLLFGLPVWEAVIANYTQSLQAISTSGATWLLKLFQLDPITQDSSIYLPKFTLDVAEACSGLKTLIAVAAIVAFFVFVAHLKWWANGILLVLGLVISVAVNSLRIALIGIVGNSYGAEAAAKFHDYSGYIALVLCFLLLLVSTKLLGWKS